MATKDSDDQVGPKQPVYPRLDEHGHEVPDPRPMAIPAGFRRPETLAEQVQRLVRTHISMQAQNEGFESFEEAEDFDIEDDHGEPTTPYETEFDPVLGREITPAEFSLHQERYRREMLDRQARHFARRDLEHEVAQPRSRKQPAKDAGDPPAKPAAKEPPSPTG
ncbi:hypothetical protein [Apis mellifera associated microvirus 39]|nr:hypothetical protein [Apis mellifera associated microvirus 39]